VKVIQARIAQFACMPHCRLYVQQIWSHWLHPISLFHL